MTSIERTFVYYDFTLLSSPVLETGRAHGRATRAAMLEHGVRLAAHGGLPAASIGALAATLGMSKSAVFAHFGSKTGLDQALVAAAVARFERQVVPRRPRRRRAWPGWRRSAKRGWRGPGPTTRPCTCSPGPARWPSPPPRDAILAWRRAWRAALAAQAAARGDGRRAGRQTRPPMSSPSSSMRCSSPRCATPSAARRGRRPRALRYRAPAASSRGCRRARRCPRMKIATWNVNGIRARQGQLLDWLAAERPDVVCLQEIKASIDQLPFDLRELEHYWVGLARRQGLLGRGAARRQGPERRCRRRSRTRRSTSSRG